MHGQYYHPNIFALHSPKGNMGNLGRLEAGYRKSGVLEHKSGNISETRKNRGKVKMEGL